MEKVEKYLDRIRRYYKSHPEKPKGNRELILKYLDNKLNQGLREQTVCTAAENMLEFSRWLEKPVNDLTKEDIDNFFVYLRNRKFEWKGEERNYSESSVHTLKIAVKTFLSWNGQKELANFKTRNPKKRKLPEDLLTSEEVERLIEACQNLRDSALLATLYESGARKGELFSVRLKHVVFDENGTVVTLPDGKTGARRIRLVWASSYLRNWIENHPTKENRESYLFVSLHPPFGKISSTGLYNQLEKIAKRIGIQKRVNPHSFRHARATMLAKSLTEQQLKQYLGWTQDSSMASVYVHLSGADMDNAILKMNGIVTEDTRIEGFTIGRCPRCKEINPEKAKYCFKCGLPLTQETAITIENSKSDISKEFLLGALQDPEIQELLKNLSK